MRISDWSSDVCSSDLYAAMCTQCHLKPGLKDSELRQGLYPLPPNLSQVRVDPKDAFWVIKHGIKMSEMPAWGMVPGHDDPTIWSMALGSASSRERVCKDV